MLVYIRWPFCWFCRRVFARSMGNTQVTPISPAIPPLISLAGKLRGDRTQKQMSQRWAWRLRAAAQDLAVGSSQTRAGTGEVLPAGARQELGAAGNSFLLPGSESSFLLLQLAQLEEEVPRMGSSPGSAHTQEPGGAAGD